MLKMVMASIQATPATSRARTVRGVQRLAATTAVASPRAMVLTRTIISELSRRRMWPTPRAPATAPMPKAPSMMP